MLRGPRFLEFCLTKSCGFRAAARKEYRRGVAQSILNFSIAAPCLLKPLFILDESELQALPSTDCEVLASSLQMAALPHAWQEGATAALPHS